QQITLHGNLSGSRSGFTLSVSIIATSDAPFANLPPLANAGADQSLTTACFALVSLDSSKTSDPDGNLAFSYYTENGFSIGNGSQPIALLPGTHRLTLNAFDALGARGTSDVVVTVADDGTTQPVSGATLFEVKTPPGVTLEDVGILATSSLVLKSQANLLG